MAEYKIWFRYHSKTSETKWRMTSYSVKARSDKEAQSKVKRKFANCGFSSISLIAVLLDQSPN